MSTDLGHTASARDCVRITRPPVFFKGRSSGAITCCPVVFPCRVCSSANVLPVTVRLTICALGIQQPLRDYWNSPGFVHVCRNKSSGWLQIGQQRGALADFLEIINRQRYILTRGQSPVNAKTALVEPPVQATPAIAFSNAATHQGYLSEQFPVSAD